MKNELDDIGDYLYRPDGKRHREKDVVFPSIHGTAKESDFKDLRQFLYRPPKKRRRWLPKDKKMRTWYLNWPKEYQDYFDERVRYWIDYGYKRKTSEKRAFHDLHEHFKPLSLVDNFHMLHKSFPS